jgi:hypothetical protein
MKDELLKSLLERLLKLLEGPEPTKAVPERERPEPPEPVKLRQSEQKGIDMAAMGRAAQEERRRRPLPRGPSWS